VQKHRNRALYVDFVSCFVSQKANGANTVVSHFKGSKPVIQLLTSYNLKIHGLLYRMLALFQQPATKTLAASANMADKYCYVSLP
jgi:hypothetical protein